MHAKMPQQVAVISGASAGIGKSTARMLVERGWHVVAIGRDPSRCAAAEAQLRAAASPEARIDFLRADFSVMQDVRRVATQIAGLAERLDVLINNAGGVLDRRSVTSDGFEKTFATNHLAPFLLTRELMPLLRASATASAPGTVRVIAVSSSGHAVCRGMKWHDLNMSENFTAAGAYCQAKLANILFTRELARRAGAEGIIAQCMHPGRVASNFASHGDEAMRTYMASATTAPEEPARTLVWLATDPEAGREAGRYFHDLKAVAPAPQALDDEAARRLWAESEKLLAAIGSQPIA